MKNFVLISLLTLLATACSKKDENKLPTPTQSGANVLACKIDGKPWVVKGKSFMGSSGGVYIKPSFRDGWVIAGLADERNIRLSFDCPNFIFPKTVILKQFESNRGAITIYKNGNTIPPKDVLYQTDSLNNGVVKIETYNQVFASGTFSFTAANSYGQVVHITDGQFDIEF